MGDANSTNWKISPSLYWKIHKDARYQILGDGNSPYELGGRSTDVTQLAGTVERLVGEYYPLNGVPAPVMAKLVVLKAAAQVCETTIHEIIDAMCQDLLDHQPSIRRDA